MVRLAKTEDASDAVALICMASGGIANTLAGTDNHEEMLRVLAAFFRQQGNRLSYENTLVAERDGRVVGALVSYHGSRCQELDRPFLERQLAQDGRIQRPIAVEAQGDEYYLDALAVAEEYRGRGIARALIAAFEIKAQTEGHAKVALLAEESNKPAYHLYRKLGYVTDARVRIHDYDFHHMVKLLPMSAKEAALSP